MKRTITIEGAPSSFFAELAGDTELVDGRLVLGNGATIDPRECGDGFVVVRIPSLGFRAKRTSGGLTRLVFDRPVTVDEAVVSLGGRPTDEGFKASGYTVRGWQGRRRDVLAA